MNHAGAQTLSAAAPPTGRLIAGAAILVVWLMAKVVGPIIIVNSSLSAEWKAILTAVLFIGVSKVCLFGAVFVLGKPGFAYLKGKILGVFAPFAPPQEVAQGRYTLGLMLFSLPAVMGWALPYAEHAVPALATRHETWDWLADLMLLASFFVLGGEFWDKIKALFSYDMRVEIKSGHGACSSTARLSETALDVTLGVFVLGQVALVVIAIGVLRGWLPPAGGLLIFLAEAAILVPVIVAGKPLHETIIGNLGRNPRHLIVSRGRYRLGLMMFALPILLGLVEPYLRDTIPLYASNKIAINLAADILLLASLFVLAGDFWDKLRALYVHGAVARPAAMDPAA